MPKNSSTVVLKRWLALDRALSYRRGSLEDGLDAPAFAKRQGVALRTVYRDIAAFRALGQRIDKLKEEVWGQRGQRYRWRYAAGVQALFTVNATR
jgi:hypothetical protein